MDLKMNKTFSINFPTLFFVAVILSMCSIETVSCRPSDKHIQPGTVMEEFISEFDLEPAEFGKILKCYEDDDLMELCQRCAKATKAKIVFPMCCSNEDNVKNWCTEYVYYGIQ